MKLLEEGVRGVVVVVAVDVVDGAAVVVVESEEEEEVAMDDELGLTPVGRWSIPRTRSKNCIMLLCALLPPEYWT